MIVEKNGVFENRDTAETGIDTGNDTDLGTDTGTRIAIASAAGDGHCCCKKKATCLQDHAPNGKYSPTFANNWQLQLGPGVKHGKWCCVLYASECGNIPNVNGFFKASTKGGWRTPTKGRTCAEREAGYGGSLDLPISVKIIWIRHGQACHNVEQKYGNGWAGCRYGSNLLTGLYDPPLSNCGKTNSKKAGQSLSKGKFLEETTFFGSSNMIRAMQTAALVFPKEKTIVPLPYVHEVGTSRCNTPMSNSTAQQAKINGLTGDDTTKRFNMKYMDEPTLRGARESYDNFKRFFARTVYREFGKDSLNSAIASHSHFITGVLEADCPKEVETAAKAQGGKEYKMNNNEAWTVEYKVTRNANGFLLLERDKNTKCAKLDGVDVEMPTHICERDWADCEGNTPLDAVKEKLAKVQKAIWEGRGTDVANDPNLAVMARLTPS